MTRALTEAGIPIAEANALLTWEQVLGGAKAKGFNEDQPRDERGRWTTVGYTPGYTDEGTTSTARLQESFKYVEGLSSFDERKLESDLKARNVGEIGTALAARPELQESLQKIGEEMVIHPVAGAGFRIEDDGTLGGMGTLYQTDHLGLREGMTVEEVGAREVAARLQDAWMTSSTNRSDLSWSMQIAAAEKMGLSTDTVDDTLRGTGLMGDRVEPLLGLDDQPLPEWVALGDPSRGDSGQDTVDRAHYLAESPVLRAYVDEVYDRTQVELKERGVGEEITLYRGGAFPGLGVGNQTVEMNPLSSFSLDYKQAREFANLKAAMGKDWESARVLTATVPTSQVFSMPHSGPGCLNELELIVVGGTERVQSEETHG